MNLQNKTERFSLAIVSTDSYTSGDFYANSRDIHHHFLDSTVDTILLTFNYWKTEERNRNGNSKCVWYC